MFTMLDYQRIQNQEYLLNEEEISSILSDIDKLSFSRKIKYLFKIVICRYSQLFPTSFSPNQIKMDEILHELLMQLLNFLSIKTSKRFLSIQEFIDNIQPYQLTKDPKEGQKKSETKSITYQTPISFQKSISELSFYKFKRITSVSVSAPGLKSTYAVVDQVVNKKVLEFTPLFDYLLSLTDYTPNENGFAQKWFQSADRPTEDSLGEWTKEEPAKIPLQPRHEGKYFMAVLLRAINSKDLPYRKQNVDGISRQSLNSLLEKIYYAYQRADQIYADSMERFLFLINTENIFHVSLAYIIFRDYNLFLTQYGNSAKLGFKYSFRLLYAMRLCPLDSLALALWDTYKEKFFNEGKDNENYSFIEQFWGATSNLTQDAPTCLARDFQEMVDCLYYLILKTTNCFSCEEDDITHMNTLKNDILNYLSETPEQKLSWSLLETKHENLSNKNLYIPSTFSHYFNFLIIHALFLPSNQPFESFMRELNLDYAVNRYIEFLLGHKKEK